MLNNGPGGGSLQGDRRKSSAASITGPGPARIGGLDIKVSAMQWGGCKSGARRTGQRNG